ncbi:MAG: hypothetical protein MK078_14975 [Crocinitomicaceae bacterium]|nr:hypothetical protein [Crocinitomicaceae bacterium]
MKKAFKQFLALGLGLLVFIACTGEEKSREDKIASMMTEMNAPFFMMSMNPQNLMDKSGVMDGVLPFTYELILSFFIDESVTGIDYDTDAQVIVTNGSGFTPDFFVIFKVKKEETFVELLEKEANAKIEEKEDFKYAIKKSDQYAVTWNEEFAILANIPIDITAMFQGGGDQGQKTVDKSIRYIKAADEKEPNAEYAEFFKRDNDMSMRFDGRGFYKFFSEMSMGEAEEIEAMQETLEGTSVDFSMNFNNGNFVMEYVSNIADDIKAKYDFIGETGVDPSLLGYANGRNPVLSGSYNLEIGGMQEYLDTEMDPKQSEEFKAEVAEMGIEWDAMDDALNGQLVYMIDGYMTQEVVYDYGFEETYTDVQQVPIFAVVAGVTNPSNFADVLSEGEDIGTGVLKLGDAFIVLNDEIFFASNDSSWANKVMAGETTSISDPHNVLTEMPFGIYADFAALSQMEGLNDMEPYVNLMVDFYGSADINGGSFTFTMQDDSKNSLRILTETVADALNRMDEMANPDIQSDLDAAVEEGLKELEEVDAEEVVDDALKALEESFEE